MEEAWMNITLDLLELCRPVRPQYNTWSTLPRTPNDFFVYQQSTYPKPALALLAKPLSVPFLIPTTG